MIADTIIIAACLFIKAILSPLLLMDDVTLPQTMLDFLATLSAWIGNVNLFVPMLDLMTIIAIMTSLEVAYLGWYGTRFIIKMIRGA